MEHCGSLTFSSRETNMLLFCYFKDLHGTLTLIRIECLPRIQLARILHRARDDYDAFVIVHGTDTLAYTACALSLLLAGFRKPIVMTGFPST